MALEVTEMETEIGRVVDVLPGLVWTSTPDGLADFLNQRWLEYTGLTEDEAKGTGWQLALHPDDAAAALQLWRERVAAGVAGEVEARLRRFDGAFRWFQFRFVPLSDDSGKITKWCGINTDIEDLKRAGAERASERDLELNTIPALIHVLGTDGSVLYVNQAVLDYTGLTSEDVRKEDYRARIFYPADLKRVHEERLAALKRSARFELEMRVLGVDGCYRWFLHRYSPLLDEQGRLDRWYAASFDIEGRKRTEAELSRVNNLLNHAQRISHVGSFWTDVDADEHLWSDESYRIFELDPATARISIQTVREHIHPDDIPRYDALAAESVNIDGYEWGFRIVPRPNVVKYLRTYAHRVTEITDRLVYFGTIQDVTEFKLAEDALRRSEAFLAEGEAVSGTGSFLWNLESDYIKWSSQLYRIFEFEDGSPLTPERISTRIHPDDRQQMAEMVERAHAALDSEYEQRLLMPDGRTKNLLLVARIERDRDGRPQYRGIVQDVTERRRADQALSQVRSELAHVARVTSLNTLTASIAHEVNQPLSGIMTNAGTCLRLLTGEPPDLDRARLTVERLIRDSKRAAEVVARLRTLFSKKEATVELVDLNETAREVIALSLNELRRNEISVRLELDDDLPAVAGDRVQLQQVILNLILNASDAMCAVAGAPRHLRIVAELDENGHVRLAVSDTGVGLTDETLTGLFHAFYTTKPNGMGIGLSVSRSIIEAHQGRLWAEQNDGPGATFLFSIPSAGDKAGQQVPLQ